MRTLSTIIAATFIGCASAPPPPSAPAPEPAPAAEPAPPAPMPDHQLGLSKTGVTDVPDPPAFAHSDEPPGGNEKPPRAFPGSPPVIPHDVASFLPISVEENSCLACHELGPAGAPDDPTPVPASHATDLREAPDKVTDSVVGARWRCVACHVPQADAPPLVGSTFKK